MKLDVKYLLKDVFRFFGSYKALRDRCGTCSNVADSMRLSAESWQLLTRQLACAQRGMTSFAWRIQLYVNFFTSSQMTAAREKINNFLNLAFRKVEHLAICHAIAIYLSSIKFIQETCVLYGKTLHSESSHHRISTCTFSSCITVKKVTW